MIQRTRRRRFGTALVAAGLLCGSGAVATWLATPANAVELFSFNLRAGARGFNYYNASAADAGLGDPGATVGDTQASLESGPVGYGLATIAWPGPLAANAGTLLLVLNPATPQPVAEALNYPARAEARTGQDPPESTYDDIPGTTLKSSALADKVEADAKIAGAAGVPGTFGTTTAHSAVSTSSDGGLASSMSLVEDIDLGGVIKIESVRSTAEALTDGMKADGGAQTLVTGLTIGGQSAYVDERGLHIGEQNQPANAVANQIAQQALSSAGFSVFVSTPQKEVDGASAVVTAGSLVIGHESADGGFGTIVLGGATASVTGAPGDASLLEDLTGGEFGGGDVGDGGGSLDVGSAPTVGGAGTGATGGAGGGDDGVALGPTQNLSSAGRPIRPGAVILGILAAGLLAAGLRRLSDGVLAEQAAATTCSLEGTG